MRSFSLKLVLLLLLIQLWGAPFQALAESSKGRDIYDLFLEHVLSQKTLSCSCQFDISVEREDTLHRFTGSSEMAFDLRNRSTEKIGVRATSSIKGSPC